MSHANISIFIPHTGCPHICSFCNQRTISHTSCPPSPEKVAAVLDEAYGHILPEKRSDTEIAFFGGSFTAIDREYMISLLEAAQNYIGYNKFSGIRISTRPDCINEEILCILKKYGVTAIELGAQSMRENVLEANRRGHSPEDVVKASQLIKEHGFELGLQMMLGLYRSTPEDEIYTAEEIIRIRPRTVRIYPVAVLENTELAQLYRQGIYKLIPFDECISVCAYITGRFIDNDIKIIRLGLHAEETVESSAIAGYYHPALGELVYSERVRQLIEKELSLSDSVSAEAPDKLMSILGGHKKSNRIYFKDKNVTFKLNKELPCDSISINGKIYRIVNS
ncbi:MAG: radical SAM protein [Oscillospiraceae bacterium]|nr:radical SAM protein [Oscillospiraceae bacterium]